VNRILGQLQKLLPAGEIRLDDAALEAHAGDQWFVRHRPDAVALPRSVRSVAQILRFAHEHRIPITARGAGHGYVGGCVPVEGGIALSLARMRRIREIDRLDFVAVVQAGVITQDLQDAVERQGLFYPPDPASRTECTIGGNIATNAGGPRCLKYGVTRDYVLGLEVVLANGTITRLGGRTHKNKTGFELARLFVGSEGLLGVITEATLKLLPLPPARSALSIGCRSMRHAALTIQAVFNAGFLPCAIEVADRFTLEAVRRKFGPQQVRDACAHLIIELDGQPSSVSREIRHLERLVRQQRPAFVLTAQGPAECENLWQLRREFSYALRDTGLTKLNEDIVVPRGRLEDLFNFTAQLQEKYRLPIACFGHAGDGNIHVNIMVDETSSSAKARCSEALDDLFHGVLRLGGSITGEHGIGLAKKRWWPLAVDESVRRLHHTLKQALDPHGILNPGKFVG
jgi:glycolate oxidase